jgi:acetyl-CoA synthetase
VLSHARGATYDELRSGFRWGLPERFNMGTACADEQAPSALALVEQLPDGTVREHTFGQLTDGSDRLANALVGLGVGPGDRVGVALPQRLETGLAHLAAWKLGAVSVPLSGLFGPGALRFRLGDADARVVLVDEAGLERAAELAARDTALSVGSGINVLRRGSDGAWRYAIALMDLDQLTTKKEQR